MDEFGKFIMGTKLVTGNRIPVSGFFLQLLSGFKPYSFHSATLPNEKSGIKNACKMLKKPFFEIINDFNYYDHNDSMIFFNAGNKVSLRDFRQLRGLFCTVTETFPATGVK